MGQLEVFLQLYIWHHEEEEDFHCESTFSSCQVELADGAKSHPVNSDWRAARTPARAATPRVLCMISDRADDVTEE